MVTNVLVLSWWAISQQRCKKWAIGQKRLATTDLESLGCVHDGFLLKGARYVQAVQLLSGNLPTRMAMHRGHSSDLDLVSCRRCPRAANQRETVAHVLNGCPWGHSRWIARHDAVVRKIAQALEKDPEMRVIIEPRLCVDQEGLEPDLVVVHEEFVRVVEVTVPHDHSHASLDERYRAKRDKYSARAVRNEIRERLAPSVDLSNVVVIPVVVGSRGAIFGLTQNSLKLLKIWKYTRSLQCLIISHGVTLFNNFSNEYHSSCGLPNCNWKKRRRL